MSNNILLSNYDLINLCNRYNIPLIDVDSKDKFIMQPVEGAYIINLEDSGATGTHWTALILNKKYVSYFDPFGLAMPTDIKRFVSWWLFDYPKIEVIHNIDQLQPIISEFCGWYCIYWLYFHLVLHKNNIDNGYLMNKHNNIYTLEHKKLNDKILVKLIKNIESI